ncbi:phosphate signaling complex protein PhoU [Flaviflagellibacter deserti]|uniref:Phosphate-specific transport system accessory protein PhoU n=1 Tax=Flaviflagellibacter deserti TaxID=2267266 RepID=A0ABV9YWI7_9HYPH
MDHTSRAFDDELLGLTSRIQEMGDLARHLFENAITALRTGDVSLGQRAVHQDLSIDQMQIEIEDLAILIIARRQPVASDLRHVIACMRMASDLERVGDLAKSIAARVTSENNALSQMAISSSLKRLAAAVQKQLSRVLIAFDRLDAEAAEAVRLGDVKIDELYNALFRELLTYMMEDARSIGQCTNLLFCAKNLERIGDHATNLAENIQYALTGRQPLAARPKGDTVTGLP